MEFLDRFEEAMQDLTSNMDEIEGLMQRIETEAKQGAVSGEAMWKMSLKMGEVINKQAQLTSEMFDYTESLALENRCLRLIMSLSGGEKNAENNPGED